MLDLAQVSSFIDDANFPIHKEDLAEHARLRGANDDIVGFIQRLPMDEVYSEVDVLDAANPLH